MICVSQISAKTGKPSQHLVPAEAVGAYDLRDKPPPERDVGESIPREGNRLERDADDDLRQEFRV